MQLSSFIEALTSSSTSEDAFRHLCREVEPLGYDKIALFSIKCPTHNNAAVTDDNASPILISNYKPDYLAEYNELKHYVIDPILPLALQNIIPIVWDETIPMLTLSDAQHVFIDRRMKAGFYNEITCPIHGQDGRVLALRFALGRPGEVDRSHISTLQALSIHFYYAYAKFLGANSTKKEQTEGLSDHHQLQLSDELTLSQREQEVMLWTARGKSASSISVILGLSENTVNFYVKNAMKKLGTTNRVVAVVLAVRSGLIRP